MSRKHDLAVMVAAAVSSFSALAWADSRIPAATCRETTTSATRTYIDGFAQLSRTGTGIATVACPHTDVGNSTTEVRAYLFNLAPASDAKVGLCAASLNGAGADCNDRKAATATGSITVLLNTATELDPWTGSTLSWHKSVIIELGAGDAVYGINVF